MKNGRFWTNFCHRWVPFYGGGMWGVSFRVLRHGNRGSNVRSKCVCVTTTCILIATLTIAGLRSTTSGDSVFCLNWSTQTAIDKLCQHFADGQVAGDLCRDLCDRHHDRLTPGQCWRTSPHLAKEVAFVAERSGGGGEVFVKAKYEDVERFDRYPFKLAAEDSDHGRAIQSQFGDAIGAIVYHNFHVNSSLDPINLVTRNAAAGLASAIPLPEQPVMFTIWLLAQQKEYLLFKLYERSRLFPAVRGTCGHFYATERLMPLPSLLHLNWSARLRLAGDILRLLELAQTSFSSALRVCDVKLDHFGVLNDAQDGRPTVRLLDGDDVYFQSVLDGFRRRDRCRCDGDCSFFDCRMRCDLASSTCDARTANNNVQAVCEKMFVGRSGLHGMLEPGFLHSAPPDMAERIERLGVACRYDGRPTDFNELLRTVREILTLE